MFNQLQVHLQFYGVTPLVAAYTSYTLKCRMCLLCRTIASEVLAACGLDMYVDTLLRITRFKQLNLQLLRPTSNIARVGCTTTTTDCVKGNFSEFEVGPQFFPQIHP